MDSGFELKNENPKKRANCFSRLFFTWIVKLYRTRARRSLQISDLYQILPYDQSEKLGDKLEINWDNEKTRAKLKDVEPKLLRALVKTYFWHYMVYGGILFFQHCILRSFQPMVLAYLISLFSDTGANNRDAMYISSGILVFISLLIILTMHHSNFGQASIGMRIRIALSSLIYRKTLKLNKKSLNHVAVGQVVNLLSNDLSRFDLVILHLHYLWIMPFQVALITYLLWYEVGISSMAGVLSIALLSLPVQGYLGKLTSSLRLKVAQKTDHRVNLMSELISGIQVIKMYAWEKPFEKIVRLARLHEVQSLTHTSYLRGIYLSFMIFVERAALFISIVVHVLLGNVLLAEQVFSMSQFFSLLQLTMTIFYPMSISYGAEALVAIDRVQDFLLMEETEESVIEEDPKIGVVVENVEASWGPQIVLDNISLRIPPGSLCAVIGPVGSAKSSLLQLLLSELQPDSGSVKVQGRISYASQEPWLFAATVRNNILFGQEYNKSIYNKVVKVCALQKDFDQFPCGDKTLVGERGTSLSGGQRARINLARAIYRDAEVYLLDDPLSAVDTHVGKHLFEECIVKHLHEKTRILVTHQLQYLKKADLIILMSGGKVEAVGTYEELSSSGLNLTEDMMSGEEDNEPEKNPLVLSGSFMVDSLEQASELLEEEEIRVGPSSPLLDYIKASGNCCQIFLVVFSFLLAQILCSGSDYFVTFWTQQETLKGENRTYYQTVQIPVEETIEYIPMNGDPEGSYHYTITEMKNVTKAVTEEVHLAVIDTYLAIYIYTGLIVCVIVVTLMRSFLYFTMAMKASKTLHNRMFINLLEAPMRFFNSNPSGRILNRFSKDMGAIDEILPRVLLESIQITLVMCGILVMVVISNYYMVVAVVILGFFFMKIRTWFISTAKDIKRLEGITKSPVFSHLNSSLYGMITIRAFGAEKMLKNQFDSLQDVHTSSWFLVITTMVSFGLWLDLICVMFIAATSFSFIILNQFGQVSGSMVGLAISQSLVLTGMLQYGIRQTAEVVNQLTCVERVLQYTEIEKEGPLETAPEHRPQEPWPNRGLLDIREMSLRYDPSEAPVLCDITMRIRPGQKIGVVGRTGAGKSSLIAALFRLADIEGTIAVDGVDTGNLGLRDLRRKISIIPQEPVLFSATLRYNLDPFEEFPDEMLWRVLGDVELRDSIESLDMVVAGGGGNFSVGQRQLVCLARAILRNNKILLLDEATANIDLKTDSLIQKTIRKKFRDCTVVTVAHRLNTIMDSDRVIVMDNGKIVEFDYPYSLLQNPDTLFYKMVLETGLSMSLRLEDIALDAFLNRHQDDED